MKRFLLAGLIALIALFTVGTHVVGATSEKVFVCKYVGTPGIDERLQTGQNPISVSVNAIKDFEGVGSYFNDAQGRSLVVAYDYGQEEEPTCPTPNPTSAPSVEPTATPSDGPTASPTPSETPSSEPTPTASPSTSPSESASLTPIPSVDVTPPPTDTESVASSYQDSPYTGPLFIISAIGTLAYLLIWKFKTPYRRN